MVSLGLLFLVVASVTVVDGHWWSMGTDQPVNNIVYKRYSACETDGLSRNQRALCRRYHNHMAYVSEGAQTGIRECQHQFRSHRWNCSTVKDSSVFGKVINTGSKETAFTYAIASAGVVYSVAKACRSDLLATCGCSKKPRPPGLHKDWNWGGCGDDTDYAYGFAREFIDAHERDNLSTRGKKARARKYMNLHNNEAGRMTVVTMTRPACKCHGVSGSCSLKSCWMQIPDFREIGDKLKEKHTEAVKMTIRKRGYLRPRKFPKDQLKITDLVFIESSPDYCRKNERTGVHGTKGRECNLNSRGKDGCGFLCCGRGYKTKQIEVIKQCNCKFIWCCDVRCDKCKGTVTKYFCN